jgi:hypothetical protein
MIKAGMSTLVGTSLLLFGLGCFARFSMRPKSFFLVWENINLRMGLIAKSVASLGPISSLK